MERTVPGSCPRSISHFSLLELCTVARMNEDPRGELSLTSYRRPNESNFDVNLRIHGFG
jgi:hypothetical protein